MGFGQPLAPTNVADELESRAAVLPDHFPIGALRQFRGLIDPLLPRIGYAALKPLDDLALGICPQTVVAACADGLGAVVIPMDKKRGGLTLPTSLAFERQSSGCVAFSAKCLELGGARRGDQHLRAPIGGGAPGLGQPFTKMLRFVEC